MVPQIFPEARILPIDALLAEGGGGGRGQEVR
jgi:hypothetical protein